MKSRNITIVPAAVLAMAMAGGAFAATDHGAHHAAAPAAAAAAASTLTAGEVRKVNLEQGKVTIRHEPIKHLDMPSMTMVFRAAKPELMKDLQVGQKIRFQAESPGGTLTVTHIEAAK